MYDIISDKLLKLSAVAMQKLTSANVVPTPENFFKLLSELVKKDPVARIVAFIDHHDAPLRIFKEDFVKRTLRMHSMTSVWLDVCVSILDGLCLSRGVIDICHLYVIKVRLSFCLLGYLIFFVEIRRGENFISQYLSSPFAHIAIS
jgi:hypothetical protein